MHYNKKNFLPQLENSVPKEGFGYTLSMYSVALEGWRRGLTLKFINNNKSRSLVKFSLGHEGKEHIFTVARGDAVPSKAIKICVNKDLTKNYLEKANVPVPKGADFDENTDDQEIIKFANSLGYPLVLKPSDGTGGNGVIANIKNEVEFKEALSYVKYDLNYKKLIVEKYFKGEDLRLYVIDNKVVGAFKKIPANVVGDGTHNIKELIKIKNEERTQTPALHNRPIKVDKETHTLLRSSGYTLESVPKADSRVYLKTKNNVSSGGDPVDVTDQLTEEMKNIAINASNAVPGLVQCGVDMIADLDKGTGVILELNSRPHITAHLFPMIGQARDIPKEVIDYYFPSTKQNITSPLYYFDFKHVFDAFSSGICKEYVIPNMPQGNLLSKVFTISGLGGDLHYKKWIRKQVLKLKLNGHAVDNNGNETLIVVSGNKAKIDEFRELIHTDYPKNKKPKMISEENWKRPMKVGFEIKENKREMAKSENENKKIEQDISQDGYFPIHLKEPKSIKKTKKSKKVKKNQLSVKEERDYYKKKYGQLLSSKSWKITKPVRFIGKKIKK